MTSDVSKTDYPNIKFTKGNIIKYAKIKYHKGKYIGTISGVGGRGFYYGFEADVNSPEISSKSKFTPSSFIVSNIEAVFERIWLYADETSNDMNLYFKGDITTALKGLKIDVKITLNGESFSRLYNLDEYNLYFRGQTIIERLSIPYDWGGWKYLTDSGNKKLECEITFN